MFGLPQRSWNRQRPCRQGKFGKVCSDYDYWQQLLWLALGILVDLKWKENKISTNLNLVDKQKIITN